MIARLACLVLPLAVAVAAGWWVGHAFGALLAGIPR